MVHRIPPVVLTGSPWYGIPSTFPEINDTEPEWAIVMEINKVCAELGWLPITRDDLL